MRRTIVVVCAVAVALAVVVALSTTRGEAQGGGRAGMMQLMGKAICDVEGLWGFATFDAKLDDAQLKKLKPVCQKAYDKRKEAMATSGGNPMAAFASLNQLGDELVKESQAALGEETAKKIEPWVTQRTEFVQSMMQRFGGGGMGGGMRQGQQ